MSPKVNSSRLYGCFQMSRIQQKLFARSTSKQMVACFFFFFGKLDISPLSLEQRRTVNSEWYTTICLPVVFQEIRKTNRRKWITIYHDNASSHTSLEATVFLSTQNVELVSQPPYSPSLATNDFFYSPT